MGLTHPLLQACTCTYTRRELHTCNQNTREQAQAPARNNSNLHTRQSARKFTEISHSITQLTQYTSNNNKIDNRGKKGK